jgi:MFS family permease
MTTTQPEPVLQEPVAPGTSATYIGKRPFRKYLGWYMLAALPIAALWGAMIIVILPNHVQLIEYARFFTGADAGTDLQALQALKGQIDAGTATATTEQSRLLGIYAQFEAARAQNLSFVTAIGVAVTMLIQPIIGVLSDRTRSRFGRRAPWMLLGAALGALALVGLRYSMTIASLVILWALVQLLFNVVQGPLAATVADRVPQKKLGVASAIGGLSLMIGGGIGSVAAGILFGLIQLNLYFFLGAAVLALIAVFVLFAPDRSSRDLEVEPLKLGPFLKSFLIPLRDADFRWVWIGKIVMMAGYAVSSGFGFFMLQSYVQPSLDAAEATALAPLLGLAGLPGTLIAMTIIGRWSDKIGRRKPFVFWASILLAASFVVPLLMPTVLGLFIQAAIAGTAFGVYIVVDQALFIDVIVDKRTAGRDLGMSTLGGNFGQALGPILGGQLIAVVGGYWVVWAAAIPIVLVAAIVILPVKRAK